MLTKSISSTSHKSIHGKDITVRKKGDIMSEKIINRNYGSIPHLSTSKLTQRADKKIEVGQETILTKKGRDWRDLVILTEKIDGSNVGVVRKDGVLKSITRAGYESITSPYQQHHLFSKWVGENISLFSWLPEGWRVCGEWCIMAHGTIYDITNESPFVAFDIFGSNNKRLVFLEFHSRCVINNIPMVPLLHIGQPVSVKNAVKLMGAGHYGNPKSPEGAVYRCERNGVVDFLAKWVRADKEDGKYLDGELWNTGADKFKEILA